MTTWTSSSRVWSRSGASCARRQPLPPPRLSRGHYAKVLCDAVFGRECFLNEVIWAYDYGARTKRRWPAKHDDILVYVKDPQRYWLTRSGGEIPYRTPVSSDRRRRHAASSRRTRGGRRSCRRRRRTDRLSHPEASGRAPTRAVGIVPSWGVVADFFAGSGTTGAAALELAGASCSWIRTRRHGGHARRLGAAGRGGDGG